MTAPASCGSSPAVNQGGFTLIEAVMVIVLIGILAAVGAPMIAHGMRVSMQTSADLTTVSQLRYATERIARELREIRYTAGAYSITAPGPAGLTFTRTDGTAVTITFASPNVTVTYGGVGTAVLTDQATALQFTYTNVNPAVSGSPSFIGIQLSLQSPVTGAGYTQHTLVSLRNRE